MKPYSPIQNHLRTGALPLLLPALLLPALILSALLAVSASAEEETAEEQEESVQAQPVQVAEEQSPAAGNANRREATNADQYQASEEISEDLSVSFPVDI